MIWSTVVKIDQKRKPGSDRPFDVLSIRKNPVLYGSKVFWTRNQYRYRSLIVALVNFDPLITVQWCWCRAGGFGDFLLVLRHF